MSKWSPQSLFENHTWTSGKPSVTYSSAISSKVLIGLDLNLLMSAKYWYLNNYGLCVLSTSFRYSQAAYCS